ncbi:MAG: leucine-rich repeat domain-containing protein [Planctomycetaceae bacterium]
MIAALEKLGSSEFAPAGVDPFANTTLDIGATKPRISRDSQASIPTKAAIKPGLLGAGRGNKRFLYSAVAAGFLGLVVLAAFIISMKSKDGTLIVEVDQPDALVQVLDAEGKVEISQKGGNGTVSISVDPGKHRLKVEKDGFNVFGQEFEMKSGGKTPIKAKLVPLDEKSALVGAKPAPLVDETKKPLFFQTPEFGPWAKEIAAMPAEQQVEAVSKKLMELNPGFDGTLTGNEWKGQPHIQNGVVTLVGFYLNDVTDISPVRALTGLKILGLTAKQPGKGKLSDLSPLRGMQVKSLFCTDTPIVDLSPLQDLPLLTQFFCQGTSVVDLSPLSKLRLTRFDCSRTPINDLSTLKGMPLTGLFCEATAVADLSPLEGMNLIEIQITPKNINRSIGVIRSMKSLKSIGTSYTDKFSPDEFWRKYDAGEFGKPIPFAKPLTDFNSPAFQQWVADTQKLSAEQQVVAVSKKLMELNPGFDGKVTDYEGNGTPKIENGVVREIRFLTDKVTDISPVRAFPELKVLSCGGTEGENSPGGNLADLSPLKDMQLTQLNCVANHQIEDISPLVGMPLSRLNLNWTNVKDLSPLRAMPLKWLFIGGTRVADLKPLEGMELNELNISHSHAVTDLTPLKKQKLWAMVLVDTSVSDLSPLKGHPLHYLHCNKSPISDLTLIKDMPLTHLTCDFKPERDTELLRSIKSLEEINGKPTAEFWKEVEEQQKKKKPSYFQTPEFGSWAKEVAAMPAQQQVEAVRQKLIELNPGFDGKVTPAITNGVVLGLQFFTDNVTDISPLKVLTELKYLECRGSGLKQGKLFNLSPLKGMKLTNLNFSSTQVADLTPLQGMPLDVLIFGDSNVADLSPIKGMRLYDLHCNFTKVPDLSLLKDMPLKRVFCDFKSESDTDVIRSIKTLETINDKPAAEFWKNVEEKK